MLYPSPLLRSFTPPLLQWTAGAGTPVAVQAITTGDSLVTTISVGSSAIDGGTRTTNYFVELKKINLTF